MDEQVIDCWRAIDQARSLRWLGYANNDDESDSVFDVEMACHYAHPANGNLHALVPGKLLLFMSPDSLLSNPSWVDTRQPAGGTVRRFSSAFLGDLLAELHVSAVVCLATTADTDAAAFGARGLDVHDLRLDPSRPGLLCAMDRLLAVAAAAPGAVALFGGGGDWADAPEYVGTLAAAWLIAKFGFAAAAAAAWVRIMCPALDAPPASTAGGGGGQPEDRSVAS